MYRFRFSFLFPPFPVFHWIVGTYVLFFEKFYTFTWVAAFIIRLMFISTDSLNMSIFTYFSSQENIYIHSYISYLHQFVMVICSRILFSSLLSCTFSSSLSVKIACIAICLTKKFAIHYPYFYISECISKVHILILCVCACALKPVCPRIFNYVLIFEWQFGCLKKNLVLNGSFFSTLKITAPLISCTLY